MNAPLRNNTLNADIRKQAKKKIDKADDTTVKMILAMLEVQENEEEVDTPLEKMIRQGVKEVNLVLAGKMKARPLKDVLNEI